jgi:hypothetical protein
VLCRVLGVLARGWIWVIDQDLDPAGLVWLLLVLRRPELEGADLLRQPLIKGLGAGARRRSGTAASCSAGRGGRGVRCDGGW